METNALFVVNHAIKKRRRGKNPSLSYNGEKNPKKALLLALADADMEKKLSLRRRSAFYNPLNERFLIGYGHYCPDCGGLCGNDKHTRRW